jgi:hypothetical protein
MRSAGPLDRETWLSCLLAGRSFAEPVQKQLLDGFQKTRSPRILLIPAAALKRRLSRTSAGCHAFLRLLAESARRSPTTAFAQDPGSTAASKRRPANLTRIQQRNGAGYAQRVSVCSYETSISQHKLSIKSGERTHFGKAYEAAELAGPPLHSLNASSPYEVEPYLATGENKANKHRVRSCSSTALS